MKTISTASVISGVRHYRHDIHTGNHVLVADEPVDAGGQDAGSTPYDLLLAGLGACTAITLRIYAEHKGWDLGVFRVELTLLKSHDDETFIERTLHSSAMLTDEQWDHLLEIASKTPVTKTLKTGAVITTQHG